ncbi:MAG TPA: aminoacyl-tRNA hydrolase [Candidatus Avoscillospira avistercoris]|uniref:Peptidyl-tRNA hydrolase n=1 Tax=Candidatus Avoscillospira avistercoris TaxID=2840707 RepID=A0A9D1F9B3_9FIRM|nr:aminoacyl-tRNA hydrolase [Candidatus Avoscillospira avistercoris]
MLFKSSPCEYLVVGLGNPGSQYEATRHNVGFRAVDALAKEAGVKIDRAKFQALTAQVTVGGVRVLLMKPQTYMNLSGVAVKQAADFYKVPPERVLVLFDDIDLDVGRLRIRRNGSAGGHNGIKSIISSLGSQEFPRIKIGVGAKPHPDYDLADWVLSRFTLAEQKLLDPAIEHAAEAVPVIFTQGIERASSQFNRK